MSLKQLPNGKWKVDIRLNGENSPRVRKSFDTKTEANRWIALKKANSINDPDYLKARNDKRRLTDIADEWHQYHGYTLKESQKRLATLKRVCEALGNPIAQKADPGDFVHYRAQRLEDGISANHLNHELTYLKAAFNELAKLKKISYSNPYKDVRKLKQPERELAFLEFEEVERLMRELARSGNPDVEVIAEISLSIGCRWGEAEQLKGEQIHNGKIHLTKTKNGRNRSIPVSDDLVERIFEGRKRRGRLFRNSLEAFRGGINRAGIELPDGQLTRILRHTYASHFMISGGNLLELNKILGHKTIQMTMVYAHLAPDHLTSAYERSVPVLLKEWKENYSGH